MAVVRTIMRYMAGQWQTTHKLHLYSNWQIEMEDQQNAHVQVNKKHWKVLKKEIESKCGKKTYKKD